MMNLKLVNSIREGKIAIKNEDEITEKIMKNIIEKLRLIIRNIRTFNLIIFFYQNSLINNIFNLDTLYY